MEYKLNVYNYGVKKISGLIQTTRFTRSFVVGLIMYIASGSIYYGIGTLLFLSFSFAFNDWADALKDNIGHPNRAIPSGKLTRKQTLYISVGLLIMGVCWSALFLKEYTLVFTVIYLFSILYSFFLKPNVPILATVVWSSAIAILFLWPFTKNLAVYAAVIILVYAYELFLDYRDRKVDKEFCKTPTLANILGKYTPTVSGLLFLSAVGLLVHVLT